MTPSRAGAIMIGRRRKVKMTFLPGKARFISRAKARPRTVSMVVTTTAKPTVNRAALRKPGEAKRSAKFRQPTHGAAGSWSVSP